MPNPDAILENIRKLMKMGLTGNDLLAQLEAMGISRPQAERWVHEATNPAQPPLSPPVIESEERTPTFAQAAARTETVPSKPVTPAPTPAYQNPAPSASVEKLWEKGILATVDAKLGQMQGLKKDMEGMIEERVEEHYHVMEKKLEALFDAQRELFKFKMDAQMAAKTNDVDNLLAQKIEEIRRLNLETKEDMQRLKGQKMVMGDILSEINSKVSTLDETKRIISTDVAQKLENLEEKVGGLIDQTDERVKDVENRATRTLELQEKITSGLTEQVQAQANLVLEARVKDLREELKNEIITLKKLGGDLASKDIQQTLNEFKTLNEQMTKTKAEMDGLGERKAREIDALLEKKLLNVDKIVNTKMETMVNAKEKDFFDKVDQQAAEMATSKRDLATKLIEADTMMQNLTLFEKQFVEMSKISNQDRNERAAEFKKIVDAFNVRADEKIHLMESRLRQLDLVVNQLSNLMSQWGAQGMAKIPSSDAPNPSPDGNKTTPVSNASSQIGKTNSPPPEKETQGANAKSEKKPRFELFKKKA